MHTTMNAFGHTMVYFWEPFNHLFVIFKHTYQNGHGYKGYYDVASTKFTVYYFINLMIKVYKSFYFIYVFKIFKFYG